MKRLWEVLEETRDAIEGDIGYMRGVDIVGEPMYQVDQERLIARMAAERDRARAQIRAREELMPEPLCIKRGERMRPVVLTAQHVLN
ncbi:MAG: hypothetical protein GTN99_02940, partial [Candidatus Dadabacteria bacterium]|nr:hypothetical protein [Candidatus Dadabacteria bacterium]